jgi:ribosomal protein S18 acetylase RimI-like enzyme
MQFAPEMLPCMTTIRRAKLADLPVLMKLQEEFRRDHRRIVLQEDRRVKPYLQRGPGAHQFDTRQMRKWLGRRNARVFIAEADSKPVGFSVVAIVKSVPTFQPTRHAFIFFMFVRRAYRGQRICSRMMAEMLAWLAKRKIEHVALTVLGDNKYARAIYKKWGFHDLVIVAWKLK